MRTCILPGSFDPVTRGHIDLIARAGRMFDRVVVGILNNRQKTPFFPIELRAELVRRACSQQGLAAEVVPFEGLLADFAKAQGACAMVRGLRGVSDFDYELQFATLHRDLLPEVETIYLMQAPEVAHISSSMVRDVGRLGGDITPWVPACILDDILRHLRG